MLLLSLLLVPITGIFIISTMPDDYSNRKFSKTVGLTASAINLIISVVIFILFNFRTRISPDKQFRFLSGSRWNINVFCFTYYNNNARILVV